jgi:alpha-glucoside transport system permease protein
LVYGQFGWNGTFLAVWLAHAGFGKPLAVYLIRNYMGSLPVEVVESAKATAPTTSRSSGG